MGRAIKSNVVVIDSVLPLETSLVGRGLVYSIDCKDRKLCIVASTTNLYQAVGRLMSILETGSIEYGSLKEDLPHCCIKILETVDKEDCKIRVRYWIDHYKSRNYREYKETNPVLYTLHTEMTYIHGKLRYVVLLRNRRGESTIVGSFKKKKEMSLWIKTSYPDTSRIGKIVVQEVLE